MMNRMRKSSAVLNNRIAKLRRYRKGHCKNYNLGRVTD
jgi:hypothetical protein